MRMSQERSGLSISDFSMVLNNGKPLIRGELGALLTSSSDQKNAPNFSNRTDNHDRLLLLSVLLLTTRLRLHNPKVYRTTASTRGSATEGTTG